MEGLSYNISGSCKFIKMSEEFASNAERIAYKLMILVLGKAIFKI